MKWSVAWAFSAAASMPFNSIAHVRVDFNLWLARSRRERRNGSVRLVCCPLRFRVENSSATTSPCSVVDGLFETLFVARDWANRL
jgi:hypothetical protein